MIRRRWVSIVIVTGLMLVFAWLTVPSESQAAKDRREEISYTASHTMIADPGASRVLDRWSLLATRGAIPAAVSEELSAGEVKAQAVEGGRQQNAARARTFMMGDTFVRVATDPSSTSLTITATDDAKAPAEQVANLLATRLQQELQSNATAEYAAQLAAATEDVDAARQELERVRPFENSANPDERAQFETADNAYIDARQRLTDLNTSGEPNAPLRTLEEATADKIVTVSGLRAPKGRTTRLLLGAGLGLVLGLGVAMVRERLDASIRGVLNAEAAAQLPVIADIPHVRITKRNRYEILSLTMPKSLFAEAYRGLRTSISLMSMAHATGAHAARDSDTADDLVITPEPKVILVASPGPSEGKSTTSANLAVTYAGMGATVLVIDLDFRRQKLHRFFRTTPGPHLANTGTMEDPDVDLGALIQPTNVPGVRFVGSAPRNSMPEHALLLARAAIARARETADIVILDAPPLLLTNDAKDLIPYADALVLLAREGRTHRKGLERASQLLRRLDAPVVGLGLIGSRSSGSYGYYRYGYGYGYGYPQRKPPRTRVTRPSVEQDTLLIDDAPPDTKRARLRVWRR
jgi:Mrp family chromosome partitioning ATPase